MTDELVNTLYKLYDRLDTIKCTNEYIIVQYGNETVPMKRNVFSRLVDNEKSRDLLKQYETLKHDEYITTGIMKEILLVVRLVLDMYNFKR